MLKEGRIIPNISGLNIYIWIGANKTNHGKRIKISNKRHCFDENDNFAISIPDYEIIAGINKIIKDDEMDNIRNFLISNIEIIDNYYNGDMDNNKLQKNIIKFSNNKINELYNHSYKSYTNVLGKFKDCYLTDSDSEYMDRFDVYTHGILNVLMYIGQSSNADDVLVKISNKNIVFDCDIFTIDVIKKEIRGVVKINIKILYKILDFIENNRDLIINYSNLNSTTLDAGSFGDLIKK